MRTLVVSASEIGRDFRFGFAKSNVSGHVGGLANRTLGLFSSAGPKIAHLSRIEIVQGAKLTMSQGRPLNFTAIGYTANNVPIGGLKFDWTIRDLGRNLTSRNLPNGIFDAQKAGHFLVTATGGDMRAQADITVESDPAWVVMERIRRDQATGRSALIDNLKQQKQYRSGEISSRTDYLRVANPFADLSESEDMNEPVSENRIHGPNAGDVKPISAAPSANAPAMMRPYDEDGWNNGNWWMADDPGNQTGNPPGTTPESAGNGNFQLSAPVLSLPGRGIDVSLALNYNSRVWSKAGNLMSFDAERGFPAPGWDLGFGKMMFMGAGGGCMLIDPDGTHHGYEGTITTYNWGGGLGAYYFNGHTTDGTFTDYYCSVSTTNGTPTSTWGAATLPNGTKVNYFVSSANKTQAFPSLLADTQGNYVSITYKNNAGPQLNTVTDTLGRVVTFNYDSMSRLISVDVPKLDNAGTRTAIRLHYKQLTLNAGWAYPVTGDTNNGSPYVVDAIYYPGTNNGFWFGADPNASDVATYYSSYGMIAKVVEQRGMGWSGSPGDQGTVTVGTMSKQAEYNYSMSPNYALTDAPTYTNLTERWAGMDNPSAMSCAGTSTDAAVTCYSVNMNATPRTVTVTRPNGLKSKQTMFHATNQWNDGLIYQDETLDGSNNQLSKSVVSWEQGDYHSPRPYQTDATDEKLQVTKTTYAYGTVYNQVTSKKIYDFDGTTLLSEARSTFENNAAYTGRHIFNLVKTSESYDGAGARVTKTDYEYDDNAVVTGAPSNPNLKATPGVTQHYSNYDPYTTETMNGNCIGGAYNYQQCTYEGEIIYVPPWPTEATCTFECTEWEQISVYDINTIFRGNLTKITAYADAATPAGAIVQTKKYDGTGNMVAESASCCELMTYDYTVATQYAYPTTQTRGSSDVNSTLRNTATYVYDFNTGLQKQLTDPMGKSTTTTFNGDTLRPTTSTFSTGAYSQTTYDEAAMTIVEEVKESGGATASKTKTYLNGIGLVVRTDSIGPGGVTDIVENKYNNLAELWKQSRPYRTGDTVQWSERFYDIQERLIKIVEPDGSETKAYYNETTRPDSASALAGRTIRVTDAWGRERWGRFDALDRLGEVVEPNPSGNGLVFSAGSLVTNYSYDSLGHLTQSDQGGQLRKFKYDSLGRVIRQKLAEQTATLNDAGTYVGEGGSGANWSSAAVYDSRSNMIQKTDPRGVKVNYSYQLNSADDPLNRIQSVSYDLSGPRDTSKPIAAAATLTFEYMTTGDQDRLKKATAAGISTSELTYDAEGRVTDQTKTLLSRSSYPMVTSYTYDTLSRVTEERSPARYGLAGSPRKLVQNSLDISSRLTALNVDGAQQAGNIVYDASEQITQVKIGASGTNQITENYTFDSQTGLMTGQTAVKGATTLIDLSYDYSRNNSNGTLSGKTGHITKVLNNLDHNKDRAYAFDAVGRLTTALGKSSKPWSQEYSYDRYGNRTEVTSSGKGLDTWPIPTDGIPTLTFNTANNRITTSGFEYDLAGNQTRALAADGVNFNRYEYDAANRLVSIKDDSGNAIQSQQFGVGNERIGLTDYISNQTTYFDPATEYTEYGGNGTLLWSRSFVYFGESILSTITPDGSGGEYVEFNHPDRLGTKVITNQAGGTAYEQAHLPFGKALDSESTITTYTKRFTSYERSARTGLDYAQNRTYDSNQGRFTQVDPIGMRDSSIVSPQTFNLYTYCANDPINNTDPSGLGFFSFLKKLFKWIAGALKWIVIAITVAVVVLSVVASHGSLSPFLASVLKFLVGVLSKIGSIMKFATGGLLAAEGTTQLAMLGLKGLWLASGVAGAISNSLQAGDKKPKRGSPAEIRATFFRLYGKKFNKCLKKIFGKDYKKIGKQTLSNSPIIDATLTPAQTGANSGVASAVGSSDPNYGKHGKVFMDNATYNSRGWNARKAVFGTYAHETANILDMRTNPNEPAATYGRVYGDPNDSFDTDTGARVERCLFGGLQYPESVVP